MEHKFETGQPVEVYNHTKNRWQPASYTGYAYRAPVIFVQASPNRRKDRRVGVYYKVQLQCGVYVHVPAKFIRPRTNAGE